MPLNQPESMLVTPHTVNPIVSPMVLMIGTTRRFPGARDEGERRSTVKETLPRGIITEY